jgi:predicted ATP-grasp superfamily ATP-dependent carboligase
LLIFGASARAAAFSALRAGLRPWCADLFGDLDLRARCPVRQLLGDRYPQGFLQVAEDGPSGPWLYTGGLENRRGLVRRLARLRPLWGNDSAVLARVRSPRFVASLLRAAGLPCPAIELRDGDLPRRGRWLRKPWAGAGGTGIRFWDGTSGEQRPDKRVYFQEYIEGESYSALYLGDGGRARLLGVTRQLVGKAWLHAAPFHYCGSIGPFPPTVALRQGLSDLGTVLSRGCQLQGLFGVDLILRDGLPWPVEVNPRYTASVEVLEHALALPVLSFHRSVFDPGAPQPQVGEVENLTFTVGKAILFARAPLTFPEEGPWLPTLQQPSPVEALAAFADIPPAGQSIPKGRPILTLFARAPGFAACLAALQDTARDLDHWLYRA